MQTQIAMGCPYTGLSKTVKFDNTTGLTGLDVRQAGFSYAAEGPANRKQDVMEDKNGERSETTFLKSFS